MGTNSMNDKPYGAHVTPIAHTEVKPPRKKRPLPADFVRRPAEELIAEYDELIGEVEATITKFRATL